MALTQEDIQTIKGLLDEQMQEIDKRFEHTDKRFELIDKQFEQVHKRFDGVDKLLNDLVEHATKDVNEMFDNHEERIKALEREVHTP